MNVNKKGKDKVETANHASTNNVDNTVFKNLLRKIRFWKKLISKTIGCGLSEFGTFVRGKQHKV